MKLSQKTKKILSLLAEILPAALFTLYSVLLFFFYLAPVVKGEADLFALKTQFNVYAILKEEMFSELHGAMGALIALAVISLVAGIFGCAFLKNPFFDIAGKLPQKITERIRLAMKFVPFFFYFLFFVISCVIYSQVNAANANISFLQYALQIRAGACPGLILSFALIFTLIHAAALAYEYSFSKKIDAPEETEEP